MLEYCLFKVLRGSFFLRGLNLITLILFSFCLTLLHGKFINFWVVLYDAAGMTTAVDARYMAERSLSADRVFDFGIGAYSYKLGTFRPLVEHVYSLVVRPHSIGALVCSIGGEVAEFMRNRLPTPIIGGIRLIKRAMRSIVVKRSRSMA